MEEQLISKKDLLEITDISYGQLYRWKRKKLIPEDWFIKKSSFTGQETFFPKVKMLERVEKIKNMKDDASLDDLAEIFSPELSNGKLDKDELIKNNIIMKEALDIYVEYHKDTVQFSFNEILYMNILESLLIEGSISLEESKIVLKTLEENYLNFTGKNCELIFLRKMGMGMCILTSLANQIYFEALAKIVMKLNISQCIENLKTKLKGVI